MISVEMYLENVKKKKKIGLLFSPNSSETLLILSLKRCKTPIHSSNNNKMLAELNPCQFNIWRKWQISKEEGEL